MHVRAVEARTPIIIAHAAAIVALATAMLLATPAHARGQAEWNIGPFLNYSTIHGGRPAAAGLQTGVLVGPVGLRASGFTGLDQPAYSTSDRPRWGGDADLMLIFDFASRGSGGAGLAPYVFAGAGLAVQNDSTGGYVSNPYDNGRSPNVTGVWSYGAGLLLPIGNNLEAMGEVRARPAGFFNLTPTSRASHNEFRIGLSIRLGTSFTRGRYRTASADLPRPPRPRRASRSDGPVDDVTHVILGGVSDAGGLTAPASASRVVPTAERYLGTPYRYGGTSPATGFDCSGFVQYVFARNAVKLPRTSRQQAKVGTRLTTDWHSLSRGDLVMFAERGQSISHVAIYAGNHRIIHSTSSGGGVRYDDLTTRRGQWFVDHMVAARRVAPDGRGLLLDLVQSLDAKSLADTALDIGDLAPRP